jgi:Ras-related protein Rab-11A
MRKYQVAKDKRKTSSVAQEAGTTAHDLHGPFSLETAIDGDRKHEILYKVIIIGDSGVGKTNLMGRWMDNRFSQTTATINVEFAAKNFLVDNRVVKIQLWDTAGQEQYRAVTRTFYRNALGAVVVYDITNYNTFYRINQWLKDVRETPGNENCQILLVGNKTDIEKGREVPTEEAVRFAKAQGLFFMETSALTGKDVHKAFQILLSEVHQLKSKSLASEAATGGLPGGGGGGAVGQGNRTVVLDNKEPPKEEGCSC